MKRYAIKEAYLTIQGEGTHAGARAVFVRFAGCNIWSGLEEHRGRDAVKGCCAEWCDTDFNGTDGNNGGMYEAEELALLIVKLWGPHRDPMCVMTGGEPSLQLDDVLLRQMHLRDIEVHVETNGSRPLPFGIDWVTLSPKPPMRVIKQQRYHEVKVIFPAVEPADYVLAPKLYLQPLDDGTGKAVAQCAQYVLDNPRWRMCLQIHKLIGVP
jgi:7-carboxy-7-deazaguanine synthase (Cx14CxxC type)